MNKLPPRYAAVIGIDSYGGGVSELHTARSDAQAVAKMLATDHDYRKPIMLLDEEATGPGIKNLIENTLPERLPSRNTREPGLRPCSLLFYFAGHGLAYNDEDGRPQGFLIPQNARRGDETTYLSMVWLREELEALGCLHLLVVLDCCYAGGFKWATTRTTSNPSFPLYDTQLRRLIQGQAWQVLTSARHDQTAADLSRNPRDREGQRHSPFAAALLEGLSGTADSWRGRHGTDGVITATELCQYIFEELCPVGEQPVQIPGLWPLTPDNSGEYLFLVPGGKIHTRKPPKLDDSHNPWLGPEAYGEQQSSLFFGRERWVRKLLDRLAAEPEPSLLTVVGASGCGKSSLVKAGVLPRLPREPGAESPGKLGVWTVVTVDAPGEDLETALGHARDELARGEHRKLLFVDQLEQLFRRCSDPAVRDSFLRGLCHVAAGEARVLIAVRVDFQSRLEAALKSLGPQTPALDVVEVEAPTLDELRRIVEAPASSKDLHFEPRSLVDELVGDVIKTPAALALLSLTLDALYCQARHRRLETGSPDRALTRQDYEGVGGVSGTVRRHAGKLLGAVSDPRWRTTIRRVALRMVRFEGWRGVRRREVSRRELEYPDREEQKRVDSLLDRLTHARLLVAQRQHLEPAHRALIRRWPPMASWLDESGDDQLLLRSLWRASWEWQQRGRADGLLWDDDPRLAELRERRMLGELNRLERSFIAASVRQRDRQDDARRLAVAGSWMAKDPTRAALVLRELVNVRSNAAVSSMLEVLGQPLARALLRHEASVPWVTFDATGTHVVTQSIHGSVQVWDLASSERVELRESGVIRAQLDAGGRRVLTVSEDGIARIWKADGSGQPIELRGAEDAVECARLSPGGSRVVTGSADGTVRVWEIGASTGRQPVVTVVFQAHESAVIDVRFNARGTRLLTVSLQEEESPRVWGVDGSGPLVLEGHGGQVYGAAFSLDVTGRTRIATASEDGTAWVWNLDSSRQPVILEGHTSAVYSAAFNADGTKILTASEDGTARVWNADGTGEPVILEGHEGPVHDATFSVDGTRVLTVAGDEPPRVWTLDRRDGLLVGEPLALRGHRADILSAEIDATGTRVATASLFDGVVRIWDTEDSSEPVDLRGHGGFLSSVEFDAAGRRVLTASDDQTARMWDLDSGQAAVLRGHDGEVVSAELDLAGRKIVTASRDGTARVWDVHGPAGPVIQSAVLEHRDVVMSASFSRDGARVVTASWDGTARVWTLDGVELAVFEHEAMVQAAAFDRSGTRVVTAADGEGPSARVWNANGSGQPVELEGEGVHSAVFSADGAKVLTVAWDGAVRVCNADGSGRPVVLEGHELHMQSAAFNRDATRVVTASLDRSARVWNAGGSGEPVVLWHDSEVLDAVFSPDGAKVLAATNDTSAWLWNVDGSGQPVVLRHHSEEGGLVAAFNRSGTRVVTAGWDGVARVWTIDGVALQDNLRAATSACLDPEFRMSFLGESRHLAWQRYADCELRHGRRPQGGARKPARRLGPDPPPPPRVDRAAGQVGRRRFVDEGRNARTHLNRMLRVPYKRRRS